MLLMTNFRGQFLEKINHKTTKRQDFWLGALMLIWLSAYILPALIDSMLDSPLTSTVLFWSFTIASAFCASLGVLLAFWWALGSEKLRLKLFINFCVFIFLLMLGATKALLLTLILNGTMIEYYSMRSCTVEIGTCSAFTSTTEPSERLKSAGIFFSFSGLNLLGSRIEGTLKTPPTQESEKSWRAHQELQIERTRATEFIQKVAKVAIYVFIVHSIVAMMTFILGGLWFRRSDNAQ